MLLSVDWKFFITIAATIAGVVVPVWLWQSDQRARSISVRVVSVTSLQPKLVDPKLGLQLSVGNTKVGRATLSVLDVQNDGSRPIPTTDFEGPLDVTVQEGSVLLRVSVSVSKPSSLRPAVTSTTQTLSIQPLLLNPGDTISLSILSDGEVPKFTAKARIAGVNEIQVSEAKSSFKRTTVLWMQVVVGCILFGAYATLLVAADFPAKYPASRKKLHVWGFIACGGAVMLFFPLIDEFNLTFLQFMGMVLAIGVITGMIVLVSVLVRKNAP